MRIRLRPVVLSAVALLSFGLPGRAGLVINPTYDASITSNPNAATIMATLNSAIAEYAANFSDNITVNIKFQTGGGLGSSNTWISQQSYSTVRSALIADQTTVDDATANATLPNIATSPVDGNTNMWVTFANLRAVGINPGASPDGFDGTITLNTSIMNLDRVTINPAKYDLKSVAQHEIDEVLGMGSGLNLPSNFPRLSRPQDLFRYSAAGARSYTTSSTAKSYFSIDGGVTNLAGFNQNSGGDYGDYDNGSVRVQNAFGTPGATPNLDVELIDLDVIGYDRVRPALITPEPGTMLTAGIGAFAALWYARRRRSA